jgi:NTE family protein
MAMALSSQSVHQPVGPVPPPVHEQLADDGIALTLSGGGYRAMLFHVGALWRLNELGLLGKLSRISSVSGGSIANGRLAAAWRDLSFRDGVATAFDDAFVRPLRVLASLTVDRAAVLTGWVTRRPIANCLAQIYDRHLLHGMTLQELPDDLAGEGPRFVFNATSLQTGGVFRFSRQYAGDYHVGVIDRPELAVALAVAASSAFPPMLSPLVLDIPQGALVPGSGSDLQEPPFDQRVVLADGGVYDNLGLEGVYRRYRRILVSDASALLHPDPRPAHGWLRLAMRAMDVQGAQVRDLRVRQLMAAYGLPEDEGELWRRGAYWGISANMDSYACTDALPCPHDRVMRLATLHTRLAALPDATQDRLINWGYAICDAAVRRWVEPGAPVPASFPYPRQPV